MKINKFILMLLAAVTASAILFQACKKEEEPKELTLSALVSGDIDLNSATSPTTVPVEPTIVATFSTNIDAQTANASSITLTQDYDQTKIELDISVSEATITIKPKTTLGTGTLYKLSFSDAIQSTEQKTLSGFERSFTTIGT
ncbi:MAG: Ig-like domain-containing protein, partial [Bacteroidales bacterium]|nr:Ig-like domain-containing protein [Bacteroidales bacterium]